MTNIGTSTRFLLVIALLLTCSVELLAQEQEVIYIKDYRSNKDISQKKANYSKTTIFHANTTTIEVYELKTGKLVARNSKRGDEPIGKWLEYDGENSRELDYDFDVDYSNIPEFNDEALKEIPDLSKDCDSLNYQAPVVGVGDFSMNIMRQLQQHLLYPDFAKDMGMQGTVYVYFEISSAGIIENIKIRRGVHIILDKESIRAFRCVKVDSPAKLNGLPIKMSFTVPVKFQLQ